MSAIRTLATGSALAALVAVGVTAAPPPRPRASRSVPPAPARSPDMEAQGQGRQRPDPGRVRGRQQPGRPDMGGADLDNGVRVAAGTATTVAPERVVHLLADHPQCRRDRHHRRRRDQCRHGRDLPRPRRLRRLTRPPWPRKVMTMMRRILWPLASAVALLPATIGLVGNPSLSQSVPLQIPAHAQLATSSESSSPTSRPTDASTEPGDDNSADHGTDDNGTDPVDFGDDHGGTRGGHGADDPTPTATASATTEGQWRLGPRLGQLDLRVRFGLGPRVGRLDVLRVRLGLGPRVGRLEWFRAPGSPPLKNGRHSR